MLALHVIFKIALESVRLAAVWNWTGPVTEFLSRRGGRFIVRIHEV
jgi:hypothetical protein